MKDKRAVILCGGKGTRLMPYTVALPKPLMPIGDYPIIEVIVRQLKEYGYKKITLAVNHQADIFKAFFGDGKKWGIEIDYVLEKKPLGTMGALGLIDDLSENFLVMNGDVLTDMNFGEFYESHQINKSIFSISSFKRNHLVDFGVLEKSSESYLTGFREKPEFNFEVSMGVYMVNKEAVKYIQKDSFFGFDSLMLKFIDNGDKVKLIEHEGFWLDIGRPDDYIMATEVFNKNKHKFINE
mgnify:CR=1 FL=1